MVTAIEIGLAAAATVLMFLLVLAQAGQRYLPIDGWPWTGELARFCLVWLAFVVTGVLVTTDGHIALEVVDLVKNPLVVRAVRVFACLVVAAIGAGFAVEAFELMQSQARLKSPSLRMPMPWLYVLPLIGFVSTAVRGLVAAGVIAVRGVPAGHAPMMAGVE
ncbi:TRAP transporter small permease [Modestobacter versicolor]|uniref:TRAP transporter small permease n=1 Tax=Modestobacter versicolor TaxID=429133 RepID=A0A323VWT4_9ACTN|nr:TRAP transporter small permease subunit [Modestobacter versicolor]MBB3674711.1 TRAP-type C4-dicarboxylate transport system permease small subunit [Modestobacter versicolor]PZA23228.1 TRAP transporter small permease [Modestobacter versicolor]